MPVAKFRVDDPEVAQLVATLDLINIGNYQALVADVIKTLREGYKKELVNLLGSERVEGLKDVEKKCIKVLADKIKEAFEEVAEECDEDRGVLAFVFIYSLMIATENTLLENGEVMLRTGAEVLESEFSADVK